MEIMQVMGSLVCTNRVPGFAHQNLRVLRTPKGKLSVACDPVGASPGNWVFTASGSCAVFSMIGTSSVSWYPTPRRPFIISRCVQRKTSPRVTSVASSAFWL